MPLFSDIYHRGQTGLIITEGANKDLQTNWYNDNKSATICADITGLLLDVGADHEHLYLTVLEGVRHLHTAGKDVQGCCVVSPVAASALLITCHIVTPAPTLTCRPAPASLSRSQSEQRSKINWRGSGSVPVTGSGLTPAHLLICSSADCHCIPGGSSWHHSGVAQ